MVLDDFRYCRLKTCPNPTKIDAYADLSQQISDKEKQEVMKQLDWCKDCERYYNEKWVQIFQVFKEYRHKKHWSPKAFIIFFEMTAAEFDNLKTTNRITIFEIEGNDFIDMDSVYLHGRHHSRLKWIDIYKKFRK